MSKIVITVISDTHNKHNQLDLPSGDILIHAGDATNMGTVPEVENFLTWFQSQKYSYKIFIAGNHDWFWEHEGRRQKRKPDRHRAATLLTDVLYLQNSNKVLRTSEDFPIHVWGSPITPTFCDWAFNVRRGASIKMYWDKIPNGTDILVTHGPPNGILDYVPRGENVGCEELRKAVQRVKPKIHIFGHIHCGYGMREVDGTTFINAAICDEACKVVHKPVTFEVTLPDWSINFL